ncbi:capsule assembly Wzi family protein [Olivibacter jilunii]|uniref:capsule assembly Wzi family protein n=1 Tax=Olivibacter jilunii TaxID=985016 RepID=UPI003F173555
MNRLLGSPKRLLNLCLLFLLLKAMSATGQSLPLGTTALNDYYRREQLLGKLDSTVSFAVQPLTKQVIKRRNLYDPDNSLQSKSIYYSKKEKGSLQLLPVIWQHELTTAYPYGWNDGSMIPAKGYQTMFSAGIYAAYKFLSVQFRPEFVFAQNSAYRGVTAETEEQWYRYYFNYANRIDMPERFGNSNYTKFFPGQSSIRLNFHPISIGVSTENLWWGPGMRNSLLMSNTAPGFLHATINTTRPVRTPIGSFEGQLVGGRLNSSGYTPRQMSGLATEYDNFLINKPNDWRYFSGMVLSYQPKWLKGLSLGLIRTFIVYSEDMGNKLGDYIPLFQSGSKARYEGSDGNNIQDESGQDQYFSIFGRLAIPSAKFEVYGEYARNDHPWNTRDLSVMPNHSRAYIVGMRKLVPLNNRHHDLLQVNFELTQLEMPKTVEQRESTPMYVHYQVLDGYTHMGQVIGAGIGPGSNVQSVNISWLRGMKQLGVQLERYVHNNDLFYYVYRDMRRNWVDYSLAFHGEWNYKNYIFYGKTQFIQANNYQYQIKPNEDPEKFWDFGRVDKFNFQLQLGLMYRF